VSVCIGRHVGSSKDSRPFNIRLIAIDKLDFVLGSDTADHLTFSAHIVRCFGTELECKVNVAKKPISSGKQTMCNAGNMIIAVTPAKESPPLTITEIMPTKGVAEEEAEGEDAGLRREQLKTRRQLLSFVGGVVELTEDLVPEASLLCIAMFMRAYRSSGVDWRPVDVSKAAVAFDVEGAKAYVSNSCWNIPSLMAIKIVCKLKAPPSAIAAILDDPKSGSRKTWDLQCVAHDVIMPLETNDPAMKAYLYRLEMKFSEKLGVPNVDFSMLHASTVNEATGGYVHVSRSVSHERVPSSATGKVVRGVALPSGWHIAADPDEGGGSEATYLVTVEKNAMKKIIGDVPIETVVQGYLGTFAKLSKLALNPKEEVKSRYNERIMAMACA